MRYVIGYYKSAVEDAVINFSASDDAKALAKAADKMNKLGVSEYCVWEKYTFPVRYISDTLPD